MQLPYSNLQIHYWNDGTTMPLTIPLDAVCNTPDEEIYQNIKINSAMHDDWVRVEPEHDGVAILCGSGPSIADHLEVIRQMQLDGGKVFAMNGAASYLKERGILADYQVIIDAREATADLVGPARNHLFASQAHPECFNRVDARIWHLQVGNIEDYFPQDYPRSYALIGGAASVGNTATCLVYALGYRKMELFGYDSSNRADASHAFHQKMNDGEPMASVQFNGKHYISSFTMKMQAEKFMETSRALRQYGCQINVHGDGLLPDMYYAPKEIMTEAEKYAKMWQFDGYRETAPGELCAEMFLEVVRPDGLVIDFGCGTGRGALKISQIVPVLLLDFVENSRDEEALSLPFELADLTKPIPHYSRYGYCTDVMEHIPPEDVVAVIRNVMNSSETVFFQISTIPDTCGTEIGQDLHLTVRPHTWWHDLFTSLGHQITWDKCLDIASMFVVKRI